MLHFVSLLSRIFFFRSVCVCLCQTRETIREDAKNFVRIRSRKTASNYSSSSSSGSSELQFVCLFFARTFCARRCLLLLSSLLLMVPRCALINFDLEKYVFCISQVRRNSLKSYKNEFIEAETMEAAFFFSQILKWNIYAQNNFIGTGTCIIHFTELNYLKSIFRFSWHNAKFVLTAVPVFVIWQYGAWHWTNMRQRKIFGSKTKKR